MNEKNFTVEEMQNWGKRFKISKEDNTRVIDTFDDTEFWTVHGHEAYNLCIRMNEIHEEALYFKRELQMELVTQAIVEGRK